MGVPGSDAPADSATWAIKAEEVRWVVIDAWPTLPEPVKAGIVAMVISEAEREV